MKKRAVCLLFLALLFLPLTALADLDVIENYFVTVDVRQDASADITYQVEWKVLDSTKEGPLEWVKIGIANTHADGLTKLTDNISSLRVTGSGGEAYVRVDLDRKYYAGETVTFAFKIHQSWLCTKLEGQYHFKFGPGWFNELEVNRFVLRWNRQGVAEASPEPKELDGYYYWEGRLKKREKGVVTVRYDESTLTPATYAADETDDDSVLMGLIALLIIGTFIFYVFYSIRSAYRRGFRGSGSRPVVITHVPHSSHSHYRGGGGSSCACACACACAGGGRAGCSAKNLYGAKYDPEKMKRALSGHTHE